MANASFLLFSSADISWFVALCLSLRLSPGSGLGQSAGADTHQRPKIVTGASMSSKTESYALDRRLFELAGGAPPIVPILPNTNATPRKWYEKPPLLTITGSGNP
jgi:hypothetical protein